MAVRIGSNISSIQAQRRLSEAASTLSKTYERLSSGQRINSAADDAAGLSIADNLRAGRRVYTQGVRNLNDGISLLQIADSAVGNLSQIVTRLRELAEQSANGPFSPEQRTAVDNEAQALQKEYFRISRSASFNGMNLFDGSLSSGLRLQAGFGLDGSLASSLGGVMGNGSFSSKSSYSTNHEPRSVVLGDVNGDGLLDMLTADADDSAISVLLGRSDGTFSAKTTYSTGSSPLCIKLGDLNGDGALDLVTADQGGWTATVFLNKGDGTFAQKTSLTAPGPCLSVSLGDLNGDGAMDLIASDQDVGANVFMGNGDGTFSRGAVYTTGPVYATSLGDINGDGILDMTVVASSMMLFIGQGDGTFSEGGSYATGSFPISAASGDLNGDGALDIVVADFADNTANVLLGRGDGSFSAKTSYTTGLSPSSVELGDVNGDGTLDIITADQMDDGVSIMLGKGDGTFSERTFYSAGDGARSTALGDINGDGVLDIATADFNAFTASVLLGGTRDGIAPLLPFSFATRAGALQAMAPLDKKLSQLTSQRGIIGAFQSRLSAAIGTLSSASENYASAESRIRDTDVASDAAQLMRLKISQEAATSVLAQANQTPALAIRLLKAN